MELLAGHGSDLNITSRAGYTPLKNACAREQKEAVFFLLRYKVDPFISTPDGLTALAIACEVRSNKIFDSLSRYESKMYRRPVSLGLASSAYTPLAIHCVYRVSVYEYQRLDFASIAAGLPIFSYKALSKNDNRTPYGVSPSFTGINDTGKEIHIQSLDEICLPMPESPDEIPYSVQRSYVSPWLWASDWFIDGDLAQSDSEGWQYGTSWNGEWTRSMPAVNITFLNIPKVLRKRRLVRILRRRTPGVLPDALPELGAEDDSVPSIPLVNGLPVVTGFWEEDPKVLACRNCRSMFSLLKRKHHCRICGLIFCRDCSDKNATLFKRDSGQMLSARVCNNCFAQIHPS
ncbi:hypothetical protein BT69DRAFT_1290644 [Atractiella rhizophila]|nr:hypothetical protein BT69DRAFT_1290644 [Atractiella rhizophila]